MRLDKVQQIYDAAAALEAPFRILQGEIKRSLERACQVHTGLRIKHLYGFGGGFQVHGLLRFLLSGQIK